MSIIVDDREIEITVNGRPVVHLFDNDGSETFDVSATVEYFDGAEMRVIEPGDVLKVEYL